jgi:outer membrane translocation and assembly module TamA
MRAGRGRALSYLSRIDLRGYPLGSYQDRMLLAVQGEWRWRFAERFVLAAFAGIGQVAPDVEEFSAQHWLPSLGAGLRYTIAPENKIGLRFDAAVGRDDYAFYFSVGEAF